jgi:hypothetical protein
METSNFALVEKEHVGSMVFPQEEVLITAAAREERKVAMNRAISLGNLEHHKVKIYFIDNEGEKLVHTTLWAVTDESIVLKQNVVIPVHRIIKLEI